MGELVQIDGSPHDWFEGRAARGSLLVFIDDATGQLLQLRFVQSESFFSYAQAAEGYFRQYGKPAAFYSDKYGIFRVNLPSTGTGTALTLQDRLPKEMRLRKICSWEAGNAFLPEFLADFNSRFAEEPRSNVNAHRPLTPQDDLARTLSWQETRSLSKNLTLQFYKTVYQIQSKRPSYALRNAQVTHRLYQCQRRHLHPV